VPRENAEAKNRGGFFLLLAEHYGQPPAAERPVGSGGRDRVGLAISLLVKDDQRPGVNAQVAPKGGTPLDPGRV
jgi:hypothetical protein